MLSQHEQGLARIDHAVSAAMRDHAELRRLWRRCFTEQADQGLRDVIVSLARGELDAFVDRIDTLTRLREHVEANPPVERRSTMIEATRRVDSHLQEQTVRDDLHNRDLLRENHVLAHCGALRRAKVYRALIAPDRGLSRRERRLASVTAHQAFGSPYVVGKYTPRTETIGVVAGKRQKANVWLADDSLTFNSGGTLRYEDAFDDDGSSDREERIALRVEQGMSWRYARMTVLTEDDLQDQEILDGADGEAVNVHEEIPVDHDSEVVTNEEDAESKDYAPAIIRKVRTHVAPSISDEPTHPAWRIDPSLYLPMDALSGLAVREHLQRQEREHEDWIQLAWEGDPFVLERFEDEGVLEYERMSDLMALVPLPGIHPGQRAVDGVVRGLAKDVTVWHSPMTAELMARPAYVPSSPAQMKHGFAPRFVDIPRIDLPVETHYGCAPRPVGLAASMLRWERAGFTFEQQQRETALQLAATMRSDSPIAARIRERWA